MKKTLVLIDGHSLAYRVYFALEHTRMATSTKTPSWAVFGFFNALFSLLKQVRPDAIAISFDVGRETFRNRMYDQYKAHRDAMPDALKTQMSLITEGVEKLGIPIYKLPDYEADDVIGTLSKQAVEDGLCVKILTGDQDSFQLVSDGEVEILIPGRSAKEGLKPYNREAVYAKLGIYPEQVPDFKGLKGDASDNIPGVPGIGDKTAAKLLAEYSTLENLYDNVDAVPGKLQEKLKTYKDQAFLSKQLAIINRQSPISATWEDCHLHIPDLPAFLGFLDRMEFRNFKQQAPDLLAPFLNGTANGSGNGSSAQAFTATEVPISTQAIFQESMAATEIPHDLITDTSALNALVKELEQAGVFSLDIETTGLDVFSDTLVGISISYFKTTLPFERFEYNAQNILALKDYPEKFTALRLNPKTAVADLKDIRTVYIPIAHQNTTPQLSQADVLQTLKPLLVNTDIVKIVHNAKFELNFFRTLGIDWQGLVFDTMIASYVINSDRRHGLKVLGYELLQCQMQELSTLLGTGKKAITFDQLPIEKASPYAACDAYATLGLAAKFLGIMANDRDAQTLFYEIEMPLAHVLANMERTGVALDVSYLKTLGDHIEKELNTIEKKIYQLSGCEFNINSPKQVGEVLFEKLGIEPLRKTASKTAYSTDAKVLEQLADEHAVVQEILNYRQMFKLKSTYVDTLPQMIHPQTQRIHTSYNQTVAATGRLSSSDPNLQNIPIRTELGREIRQAFVPQEREGWSLLSADYSQIELRLLAHFSEDPNLLEAFRKGEDIHTATAALVFGLDPKNISKEQRYKAKAVNFGVVYGQSAHGLSQALQIPRHEAQFFIERYFKKYPNVKGFIESVKEEAHKTGRVKTLCGRYRDLSEGLNSKVRQIKEFSERAAFNTPLQGSAADLMKVAMIRLARKLADEKLQTKLIMQVHDELVLEVPDNELTRVQDMVHWAMELDQPLKAPLVVDMSVGKTWLES